MRWDLVGDLLSRARCAACDGAELRARQVFCTPCLATVERCVRAEGGVIAFGHYGGALAEALHRFKYRGSAHLARPLGHLLRAACREAALRADMVVPVPLHPARVLERGYNQAALLAAHVATELEAPLLARALTRTTETRAQAALPRRARLSNVVEGVFLVRTPGVVRGRRVALVDDVSTTGATMTACAQALFEAGADAVARVVLARTMKEM